MFFLYKTVMQVQPQQSYVRGFIGLILVGLVLITWTGCSRATRGAPTVAAGPMPLSLLVRLPPSTETTLDYKNACGESATLSIAGPLAAELRERLGRVFQRVTLDPAVPSNGTLDVAIGAKQIDVAIPRRSSSVYPATVTVGLEAAFVTEDGSKLWTKKVKGSGIGQVEVKEPSCHVIGLEAAVKEAAEIVAEGLASQMSQSGKIRDYAESKRSSGIGVAMSAASNAVAPPSSSGVPMRSPADPPIEEPAVKAGDPASSQAGDAAAVLTFRAILRDDNRDHILQSDEPLTIELEVKNDGLVEATGVEVVVGGTGALTALLPPAIVIGDVQPGEIKRAMLTKPVTSVKAPLRAELLLSLRSGSPMTQAPPVKQFTVLVTPVSSGGGQASTDVDQPPKAVASLKQPKAVVIAIGVGHFRDTQVSPMKFAARDAEVMASYLQSIGGLSADRVRVLVDGRALKQDLAETFDEWLPKRVDPNTVVYVYVAGRALVDGVTGAVSLVPYDGTTASMGRVYSLRRLQEALAHLPIQRAILMFDVSLEHAAGADPATGAAPVWETGTTDAGAKMMWMIGNNRLQESQAFESGRHGLFTYQLLRGLQGPADLDRDGTVVAGELCAFARGEVARTTSEQIGSSQQPVCLPGPGLGAMVRIHPMAKGINPKPVGSGKKEAPVPGEASNAPTAGVGPGQ